MSDDRRAIELEIEVPGTPEEVWRAIATGPGISSWYVPHTVEEREGGAMTASFGPGPEMQVDGRVFAWEPPHRFVYGGGESDAGMAFEWLVEARAGGTCVVRLVNTGFGSGSSWDDQYDQLTEGWKVFMYNLKLHLEHFRGQQATAVLPMAVWAGAAPDVWTRLLRELGIDPGVVAGQALRTTAADAPGLSGTVLEAGPQRLVLLLDQPAPGTGLLAAEGHGDAVGVSVWSYLYGPEGAAAASRDEPKWRRWLGERSAQPSHAGTA